VSILVLAPLVLVVNGLAAGVLVGTQLGGWPLLQALPPGRYVHAHAFFATRYDPFMPACLLATITGDVVLALADGDARAARALYVVAALAAAATVTISLIKNVPVNRWIRQLDPDRLPPDFTRQDPRPAWGRWNRIRTWLAVCALIANGAALSVQM